MSTEKSLYVFELFYLGKFEQKEMIRGYYVGHKHPAQHTTGRMLVAMQEAGLILMREKDIFFFNKEDALQLGFNYVMKIGNFEVPAFWEWPFKFDTNLLGADNMPAGMKRVLDWNQLLPKPLDGEINGFVEYPFRRNPVWMRPNNTRVWVTPIDSMWISPGDHTKESLLIWRVETSWAPNLDKPLPSGLTLWEAIEVAKTI